MPLSQKEQLKFKALYLQTAWQYVNDLKANLNQLGTGNVTEEVIDTLHMDAHSLAGQSAIMGYEPVQSVSSLLEKIFKARKEKRLTLSDDMLAGLLEALQSVEKCLDEIETSDKCLTMSDDIEKLNSYLPK